MRSRQEIAALVLQQHAGNVGALEVLAGGFRLILFQPGEAGAEEGFLALAGPLGERVGLAAELLGLVSAVSRRCLASFSPSKAPTWIIQPLCDLAAGSLAAAGSGTLAPAEATLAACAEHPGRAPGGGCGGRRP